MEANRIELAINEWSHQSSALQKIFSLHILEHRTYNRAKLAHYRAIDKRPFPFMNNEEKLMRYLLRGEIRRMEKVLYPSVILRIGRSIFRAIADFTMQKITEPEETTIYKKINEYNDKAENKKVAEEKIQLQIKKYLEKTPNSKKLLLPKKQRKNSAGIKR